jgi:hypothetical protein
MAAFFVGQRVRIVWVARKKNAWLVGKETMVSEILHHEGEVRYGLDVKKIEQVTEHGATVIYSFSADQLVPVTDDGQKSCGETYKVMMDKLRSRAGEPA